MSQKQNIDRSDLVESAANEAKRLKWSQDISAALFQLGELQREWDRLDSDIRNRKARVIYELAEKLEQDDMPLEFIIDFIIQGLVRSAPPGEQYVSEQYIRRLLKKTKYTLEEDVEESTSQIRNSFGFDDNNSSGQSTVQEYQTSGGSEPLEPKTKTERQLVKELETVKQELEQKDTEIQFLREAQPVDDIPQIVENRIGPIKVQNLAKVSEFDRRGFQILASRVGEVIRRKIVSDGKAGVKFYMLAKDRTTGVESIVPVMFIVDMHNRSTELKLDESKL